MNEPIKIRGRTFVDERRIGKSPSIDRAVLGNDADAESFDQSAVRRRTRCIRGPCNRIQIHPHHVVTLRQPTGNRALPASGTSGKSDYDHRTLTVSALDRPDKPRLFPAAIRPTLEANARRLW